MDINCQKINAKILNNANTIIRIATPQCRHSNKSPLPKKKKKGKRKAEGKPHNNLKGLSEFHGTKFSGKLSTNGSSFNES